MVLNPFTRQSLRRVRPWRLVILEGAREHGIDPFLFAALMLRESQGGYAKGYSPHGSAEGWGDHGHGYGLFQIDRRYHWPFVKDKPDAFAQARYSCLLLSGDRHRVRKRFPLLPTYGVVEAMLASYNAGFGNVRRALLEHRHPDSVTTGKDYSRWILTKADKLRHADPNLFHVT